MRFRDATLAIFVLAIAVALIIPLPTALLDVLITLNLGLSFLLLLVCIYIPNSLSLLTFPSILLLSTLLRLSLNVASCRLILSIGDAGEVIHAFGTFLIRGELVVGFIIFSIITAVNLIVISRGAGRVSEVAARFALEGLAGNQLAIDSDLKSGLLTAEEAHKRRDELRQESQLYGAMDGAMRFVQGDSIAGIIIIAANLVGGLYLGVSRGLDISSAVQHYSILTIGDGLVSQIPALLTAICAGMLVTRVEGGTQKSLGSDLVQQVFGRPFMVGWAGILLLGLGLLPGLPLVPFALVGGAFLGFALWSSTTRGGRLQIQSSEDGLSGGLIRSSSASNEREGIGPIVRTFTIQLDEAILAPAFFEKELFYRQRWAQCAQDAFASFGIKLPRLQVERDSSLDKGEYRVIMKGNELFWGKLNPTDVLVELGVENAELLGFVVSREEIHPCCGKTVFWSPAIPRTVSIAQAGDIRLLDFVEFLYLQVFDFYRQFPEEVLGILDVHLMIRELERKFPGTIEDALQRNFIDAPRLTELAHDLIRERIDISDFPALVESVLAYCSNYRALLSMGGDFDIGHAVAHIRVQRRRSITNRILTDQRALRAITLSPSLERLFEEIPTESGPSPMSIPPNSAHLLIESLRELIEPIRRLGIQRVCVLCRPDLRGRVAKFLRSVSGHYQVISTEELDSGLLIEQVGVWQPKR